LTAVGIDPAPLSELMNRLRANPGHLVEGIVIVKDDKLVFEEYFDGRAHPTYGDGPVSYDRDSKHCLSSVTKSVTATLLGIAIDRGFAPGVDERVLGYFPEMADLDVGLRSEITLKHLVTMSAGLQWDEWSYSLSDPRNDLTQWFRFAGDLVRFVLERPMVADPGSSRRSGLHSPPRRSSPCSRGRALPVIATDGGRRPRSTVLAPLRRRVGEARR